MGTYKYETSIDYNYYWKSCNNLYNFISYYHQLNEIYATNPNSVLEIGVGNKLVYNQLKELKNINILSMDINPKLNLDIVADIKNIPLDDNSIDTVCAFEVLEHLPFEEFETILKELKRVSKKYILISIPIVRIGVDFYFKLPKLNPIYLYINIPFKLTQKDITTDKQAHYWEVNKIGYSRKRIRKILETYFVIKKEYRIPLNKYHIMYVMEKKELI